MTHPGNTAVAHNTILLVDDSPVNLELVVESLELEGYEVLVALDGDEALQRAERVLPDLILLDVMMPGMDGFEVCRRLKANPATADIPVLFMTSLSGVRDKVDGFGAGAVDYLTKPLHIDEVRARVGAHLRLRSLHRQLEEKNAALERERATLRGFFRTLPELAWMKDAEGRYLLCNPVFETFFGAPEAEIIGKTDFDYVDAELAAFFRMKDEEAKAAGRPCRNEEWITFASDGRRALLETVKTPVYDTRGETIGIIGISHDITEQRRREDALRRNEAMLSEAQRIGRMGSWEFDLASGELAWSDEIYRIFEIDPSRFRASYPAFLELVHPDDREAVDAAYCESLKRRAPYAIDHRLLFPDGRIKHVRERCETRYDEAGAPLHSRGTVQDITEIKEVQVQLEQSQAELRKLAARREADLENVRRLLSREMHEELAQVLAALRMKVARLRGAADPSPTEIDALTRDMLAMIEGSVHKIRNVVSSVRPTSLELGIVPALEWLAADFSSGTGLPCRLHSPDLDLDLEDPHATALFRMAQEALANAFLHAQATRVELTLHRDGVGITPADLRKPTLGIVGMREQANQLGWSFRIVPTEPTGTELCIHLPAGAQD